MAQGRKKGGRGQRASTGISGDYEIYHIGVLDGIRAVAVGIVVWYHFWQQSWLTPVAGPVNLDWLVRNGSILVDMMLLLSGFCLFLPYAREMVYGERAQSPVGFYVNRVARIAPSYYISLFIVLFCFVLPLGEYGNLTDMWKDLLPHLTFTHNLFEASYIETHLNGVLWTLAVEVQYYLIFPLLAWCFMKKPVITYCGMTMVGLVSSLVISRNFESISQGMFVNHTLTFASVYANGMMGVWLYITMTKNREKKRGEGIVFTVLALAAVWLFQVLCRERLSYVSETRWQVDYRYVLSLLFLVFILSTILAAKWFRVLWDNRVMRFLAGISFNLYIWHQFIAVRLKEFRIPYWEGEVPPNQTGDTSWQWQYFLLCLGASLAVATAMTYLVERPAAKAIKKWYDSHRKKSK